MRGVKKGVLGLGITGLVVICCSWGFLVHRTVNQLAVYELPKEIIPFFYRHKEYLVANAPRPDIRRNTDHTEAPRHFIDLEMYENGSTPAMPVYWQDAVKKYTKDSLLKYGYVPYQVVFIKERLTEAFKNVNQDSILFYAADLGHYIGDANVPLHTTVNYDGQLTDQKGLHSLWETMIPEIEIGNYQLSSQHKATYLKNPAVSIWAAVRQAASLVPGMLAKEKEVSKQFTEEQKFRIQIRRGKEWKSYTSAFAKAYAAALQHTINQQLLHSADLIADFWYTAWVDAGKPDLMPLVKDWSATREQLLQKELEAFHSNKLLENKLLIAKQTESAPAN